jgi:hypothetical protein
MKRNAPQNPRPVRKTRKLNIKTLTLAALSVMVLLVMVPTALMAPPMTGAIFTTDSNCDGTDLNIYDSRAAVYLDGGPAHPGAASLPDGNYYVQVTNPSGTVLGSSVGTLNETPYQVVGGEVACLQLWSIVETASGIDGCTADQQGYCPTDNPGGEYKVWVSQGPNFDNDESKTDNFKIRGGSQPQGTLKINKFYDADVDGVPDPTEVLITGWETRVGAQATFDTIYETKKTPVNMINLAPTCYTALEGDIADPSHTWVHTNSTIQSTPVPGGGTAEINFGNVCLGPGGGLTLGFWSNKNGEKIFISNSSNIPVCSATPASDLAYMVSLNLRNANGADFNPTAYSSFRTWLLNANATNMAYMLSAQMAAMQLNVLNGNVNGGALIYAPGTGLGVNDFATVCQVLSAANTELGTNGYVLSGHPSRAYQEALKNALDKANNNLNFVQASPDQCGFVNNTVTDGLFFTYPASYTAPACP